MNKAIISGDRKIEKTGLVFFILYSLITTSLITSLIRDRLLEMHGLNNIKFNQPKFGARPIFASHFNQSVTFLRTIALLGTKFEKFSPPKHSSVLTPLFAAPFLALFSQPNRIS
ncbi:hypothetical protein BpHYR1_010781 [Brachionus plicatilis]|uniref:Uncharacterized protein n=1 Tax=Brachionus plicatilis TaxID=10195 RepID=A0A3M7QWI1_BRAPC|nr:hypothetical protein BpHYR1_010781 [Brachionus plicatilis]